MQSIDPGWRGARRGWLVAIFGVLLPISVAGQEQDLDPQPRARVPVLVDREKLSGVGLEEYPPWPSEQVLEGSGRHRGHVSFFGEEIVVEVWESDPGKFAVESFPYDEYIRVLSGKLILTDSKGNRSEYGEGDSLVVPRGFSGIWEMPGKYRELVVIEKQAYQRVEGDGE